MNLWLSGDIRRTFPGFLGGYRSWEYNGCSYFAHTAVTSTCVSFQQVFVCRSGLVITVYLALVLAKVIILLKRFSDAGPGLGVAIRPTQ